MNTLYILYVHCTWLFLFKVHWEQLGSTIHHFKIYFKIKYIFRVQVVDCRCLFSDKVQWERTGVHPVHPDQVWDWTRGVGDPHPEPVKELDFIRIPTKSKLTSLMCSLIHFSGLTKTKVFVNDIPTWRTPSRVVYTSWNWFSPLFPLKIVSLLKHT